MESLTGQGRTETPSNASAIALKLTFYRWVNQLKDGIPDSMVAEEAARERAESGDTAFVPDP